MKLFLISLISINVYAAPPTVPMIRPIEVGKFDREMKEFREQVPDEVYKKIDHFKKYPDREITLGFYVNYKEYLRQVCSSENNIQEGVTEFAGMDMTKPYSPKLLKCNNKAQVSFVEFMKNYDKYYLGERDNKKNFRLPLNESMAKECSRTLRAEIVCPEGVYKFVVKEPTEKKIDLGVDDSGRILHKRALPLPPAEELRRIDGSASGR